MIQNWTHFKEKIGKIYSDSYHLVEMFREHIVIHVENGESI